MQALNNKQLMQVSGGVELTLGRDKKNGNLSLRHNEYIILRDPITNYSHLFMPDGSVIDLAEHGRSFIEVPSVFNGEIRKYLLPSSWSLPFKR